MKKRDKYKLYILGKIYLEDRYNIIVIIVKANVISFIKKKGTN